MSKQKRHLTFLSSIPWLLVLALICTSCISVRRVTPAPPLVVADFDGCTGANNLGGDMGAAYNSPDSLKESYVEEANRGCVARLQYEISDWAAFWIKMLGSDLKPYNKLAFDVKADSEPGIPGQMKLELKRANGTEIAIAHVAGIGSDWKRIRIDLADFRPTGQNPPLATREGMEELVFTFESAKSGRQGVIYLDNIVFER